LVIKVLIPLSKEGTNGSNPPALETIALSTIDIAGAGNKQKNNQKDIK
jgi:hypothetical protein